MVGPGLTNAHGVGEPTLCGVSRSPTLTTLVSRRIAVTGPTARCPSFLGAIAPPPVRVGPMTELAPRRARWRVVGHGHGPSSPPLGRPGGSRLLMGLPRWRGVAVGAPSRRPPIAVARHRRGVAPMRCHSASSTPITVMGVTVRRALHQSPPSVRERLGECHRSPADEALVSRHCAVVTALTNARCAGEPTLRVHCRSPAPRAGRPGDEGLGWCPPPLASMPGRAGQPSRRPLRPG